MESDWTSLPSLDLSTLRQTTVRMCFLILCDTITIIVFLCSQLSSIILIISVTKWPIMDINLFENSGVYPGTCYVRMVYFAGPRILTLKTGRKHWKWKRCVWRGHWRTVTEPTTRSPRTSRRRKPVTPTRTSVQSWNVRPNLFPAFSKACRPHWWHSAH